MNTFKEITRQVTLDIQRQLDSKIRYTLLHHGFDIDVHNLDRLLVVNKDHYDQLNELWLDGVIILKWSRFSFKQDGDKLIGIFEYIEV